MRTLLVHSDGSVRTGQAAGVGFSIVDADNGYEVACLGERLPYPVHSDVAEELAAIRAVRYVRAHYRDVAVQLFCDEYGLVVRTLGGGQTVRGLRFHRPPRTMLLGELARFPSWDVAHIDRSFNWRADYLAGLASGASRWQGLVRGVDLRRPITLFPIADVGSMQELVEQVKWARLERHGARHG